MLFAGLILSLLTHSATPAALPQFPSVANLPAPKEVVPGPSPAQPPISFSPSQAPGYWPGSTSYASPSVQTARPIWQPRAGARFQIVLGDKILKLSSTTPLVPDAEIFDVDLFHTPANVIGELNRRGKRVICYFSAGSSEIWRPDIRKFQPEDQGDEMREWKGERWLDIRSAAVWTVMQERILMANQKGCSAIDPDNLFVFPSHGNWKTRFSNPTV